MNELLQRLSQPFSPDAISWKPGASKGDKCMALAYADLRAYQERLDEVCGLDWSVEYLPWGDGRLIARLTICGVSRSSTGEADAQDEKNNMAGSVAEAMALKRAAAMFGLGRYLYDLPSVWVAFDAGSKKISKEGQTELDNRYKTWYAKTIAAMPKRPIQDASTMAQQATEQRKDESAHESPPHNRMWGIGLSVFGKSDWDDARPWLIAKWTAKVTPDNTRNSTSELSDTEKDQLGDYMNDHVSTLQRVWKNYKTSQAQPEQAGA